VLARDLGKRLVADDAALRYAVIEMALEDVQVGAADPDAKHAQQAKLVGLFDAEYAARFPQLPPEYMDKMLAAIVSFTIEATRIDARFKLSQEKLPVERERIIATLESDGDSAAAETARLMRDHSRSK